MCKPQPTSEIHSSSFSSHESYPLRLSSGIRREESQCTLQMEIGAGSHESNGSKFVTAKNCDLYCVHLTLVLQPDTISWQSRLLYLQHSVSSVGFDY